MEFNQFFLNKEQLGERYQKYLNSIDKIKKNAEVYPVIKSNAYGLNANEIINILLDKGCQNFIIFSLEEAVNIRKIFKNKVNNIYVLRGLSEKEKETYVEYNITPILNSLDQIEVWQKFARKNGKILPAVLQFETGMNRSGIEYRYVDMISKKVSSNHVLEDSIKIDFIMSHLACANDIGNKNNIIQLEKFRNIISLFPKNIKKSFSATNGFELGEEFIFDIVRIGIGLHLSSMDIKNSSQNWYYYTKIINIDKIEKTASINIGYIDGYYSKISNRGFVCINNIKFKVLKVYSTYSVIYLGDFVNSIKNNDGVEIIGDNVTVHDLSEWMETIPYEVEISLLLNRTFIKARNNSNNADKLIKEFTSEIEEIRVVEDNSYVGYGASEQIKKDDLVATIPIGYSNGIIRSLGNKKLPVYINDVRYNLIGTISMNHTTINIPKEFRGRVNIGDKVYLLSEKYDELNLKNWARLTNLNVYEINKAVRILSNTESSD